jgi:hypothetical protein
MHNDQFHVPDKDPNFIYRWCNTDDRGMLLRKSQGYEVVVDTTPELDPIVKSDTPTTAGATATRRRGHDLILCRIPRTRFDETLGERRKALEAQHRSSVDDALAQVSADAESSLRARGQNARGLAFRTTPNADFKT